MDVPFTTADPFALALVASGLALGAWALARALRGSGGDPPRALDARLDAGRDHDAATACARQGRLAEAQELRLRAGDPGRAAPGSSAARKRTLPFGALDPNPCRPERRPDPLGSPSAGVAPGLAPFRVTSGTEVPAASCGGPRAPAESQAARPVRSTQDFAAPTRGGPPTDATSAGDAAPRPVPPSCGTRTALEDSWEVAPAEPSRRPAPTRPFTAVPGASSQLRPRETAPNAIPPGAGDLDAPSRPRKGTLLFHTAPDARPDGETLAAQGHGPSSIPPPP